MFFNFPIFRKSRELYIITRRLKHKKARSTKKSPQELALQHFDIYYSQVYKEKWPSIRVALLSQKKYCALINNFGDAENTCLDLLCNNTSNFVAEAQEVDLKPQTDPDYIECKESETETVPSSNDEEEIESRLGSDRLIKSQEDLADFVPVKVITSKIENMRLQEEEQNIYKPEEDRSGEVVRIISDDLQVFPPHLKAFTFDVGDVSLFPSPRRTDNGLLNYFLMDAGSVLPVLALDLFPGCSVLDMCSAPGGKMLTMLQTMLPDKIVSVDHSYSRVSRMKDILSYYVPRAHSDRHVECHKMDGMLFCSKYKDMEQFDRVLVDVPCFTDRHVLTKEESNLFQSSNTESRLLIQEIQADLLFWSILCCKPGGSIVYSTCTLSPPQNDGMISRVLERIWTTTNLNVVVQETTHIAERFKHSMIFYDDCRFGQLVLPKLTCNFGPTYFCKLKRL